MELYKIESVELIKPELIKALVDRYKAYELPRIKLLNDYYKGQTAILNRVSNDESKPNNKVVNPFSTYITDMSVGYFVGKPIRYNIADESLAEKYQEVLDKNYESSHNTKLAKSASISGIAYELIYMNEDNEVRFNVLSPEEVFMVYDNSLNSKPIAAIRFYSTIDYVSDLKIEHYELYTEDTVYKYTASEDGVLSLIEEEQHYFGGVPIVYYWNNDELMGDFERFMSLINAYDAAVSDTLNNLDYFADALLAISDAELEPEDLTAMKEARVLLLKDGADAKWLVKGADTVQAEEFKTRIKTDIFELSQVPNLGDESFGTSSGEALKHKYHGMETRTSNKEQLFAKSLLVRAKFITNILNIKGGNHSHLDIEPVFARNKPENDSYYIDLAQKLSGIVSKQTILSQLPFIKDPSHELSVIEEENSDSLYE